MNNNCRYYFSSGEGKKEISELWINAEDSSFIFRHFEDEWDDWPYPHTMEHILSGSVKLPGEIVRSGDKDLLKILSENTEFILERMIYRTLTEDDLFYEKSMEIFDLQKEDDSAFSRLYKNLCQKEGIAEFPVRPEPAKTPKNFKETYPSSFIIMNVPESKWPKFRIHTGWEDLKISWVRFPRKWSLHSDGTDAVCGGISAEAILKSRERISKSIPEILSILGNGHSSL